MQAMTKRINPLAYEALLDCLALVFWNKKPFERFLRGQLRDQPELLAGLTFAAPKREVASELVEQLSTHEERYQGTTLRMMQELAAMTEFPNLAQQTDGPEQIRRAEAAVLTLQGWVERYSDMAAARERLATEQAAQREQAARRRSFSSTLAALKERFIDFGRMEDAQLRGRQFEVLLNDLFLLFDLRPTASYDLAHQQIDGAFSFNTDDYLLEAKWVKDPVQPADLHVLCGKVASKAKNVLGLFIAVNGFTPGAIAEHSHGTPLLLMDGSHLFAVLDERIAFDELLERLRQHAAQTGSPYLALQQILS